MAPYLGYDSDTTFIPGTLNTSSSLTIQGGGITQTGGDVNFDSGTLFLDEDLNRVGIGVTNPPLKLTVVGNIRAGYDANIGVTLGLSPVGIPVNDNNSYILWGDANSFGGANGDLIYVPRTSTDTSHRFYTGTTTPQERVRITSAGNVGVGSTNPSFKLDVVGTLRATGESRFDNGINLKTSTLNYIYFDDAIAFSRNGVGERVRIDSSGNVGIGTTNPVSKLDVRGTLGVGGGSEGVWLGNVGDNTAYDNVKLYYTGYNGGGPRIYLTPRTQPGSGTINTYLHLQSNVIGGPGANTMGLIVDGSVGIGTTSPQYKLHVVSGGIVGGYGRGGGFTKTLFESNATTGAYWEFQTLPTSTFNDILFSRGTTGSYGIVGYDNSTDKMRFYTAGDWKMTIDSAGNVGIGTTNPLEKLHVESGLTVKNTGSSNTITIYPDNTNGPTIVGHTDSSGISTGAYTGSRFRPANGGFFFDTSPVTTVGVSRSWTTRVVITDIGNVGIGTANPTQKLHVVGNSYTTGYVQGANALIGDTIGSSYAVFGSNSISRPILITRDADPTGRDLFINASGNIGIGTTGPVAQFHIGGTASNNNPWGVFDISDGYFKKIIFSEERGAYGLEGYGGYVGYNASDNNLVLGVYENSVETRAINIKRDNGNVGIGTTSPGSTLEVRKGGTNTVSGNLFGGGFTQTIVSGESQLCLISNIDSSGNFGSTEVARGGIGFSWANVNDRTRFIVGTQSNHPLRFFTNNSERVRVSESGNVGIGTTNPSYKFEISESEYSRLTLLHSTSGRRWQLGNDGSNLYAYNELNAVRAFDITPTGNVGIGTTNPGSKLHIVGSTWNNTTGGDIVVSNSSAVGAAVTIKPTSSTSFSTGWSLYAGASGAAIGDGSVGFWNHTTQKDPVRIDQSDNLHIKYANLVFGTAGKGIDFSANPNPSGMTSELLNDYEEGTWTPVWQSTGTLPTLTYSTQSGYYVKIGRVVHFWGRIYMAAWGGGGGSGNIRVGGLPFTSNSDSNHGGPLCQVTFSYSGGNAVWPSGASQVFARVLNGSTSIEYISLGVPTTQLGEIGVLQWTSNPQMYNNYFSGSYFV